MRSVVVVVVGISLACGGAPGPWQGDAAFTVELDGDGPTAAVDGPRMVARLERAELTAEATVLAPDRVALAVWGARDEGVLELVTRRGALQVGPADGGLRGAHIAAASVAPGPFDGDEVVRVSLTDEGAARWCALTEASVGAAVDIAVDGVVLSSPIVQEPMCAGELVIHASWASPREASALASALGGGALDSAWTVRVARAR